ncbi:MAG: Gfo/Idh/MocA family oxidoreductase [Calothrix sp. SM1_7_51]|nr:Gfo/Idh/MocA family oxidoreductase [Calothrix sp. SM1_7_51]
MISFGVIGTGQRAEMYCRIASLCPDRFRVVGIVGRNKSRMKSLESQFSIPVYSGVDNLLSAEKCEFVVTAISRDENASFIKRVVNNSCAVLSETPPGETIEELNQLFQLSKDGAQIQVAEQFWLQPIHSARLRLIERGEIGEVINAQISIAREYHNISLIRKYLQIGYEPVLITATSSQSFIFASNKQKEYSYVNTYTDLGWFDFGKKFAQYEFTPQQYLSPIRSKRVIVRGDKGEIENNCVRGISDSKYFELTLQRCEYGTHGEPDSLYLDSIKYGKEVIYKKCTSASSFKR